ncbi:MAG TPA: aldehyde dehydrogenase [Bacteroidales bacterium]|nr:aldehyde dehydrogenase [Bacteroidales bacterium]
MDFKEVHLKQQGFFLTNQTKDVDYRKNQLKKLKELLKANEQKLFDAIYEDSGKSEFETYLTELSLLYHEISLFEKKLKSWSKPRRVWTDIANMPARSYIIPEPLGVTLVIGAWNYPYLLSLHPAACAIAAGNTVMLKPSELPSNTARVMTELINTNFPAELLHVVEGGVKETTELLELKFDKIFFTGSTNVGRIVYQAAAKHLTPVTLELGGKSPTFVFADCNLAMTAKRLVWAKFINAGQTCVAPDYVLVEKSIETKFLEALKLEIEKYHADRKDIGENYLRIINERNFDRLCRLIDPAKVYCGGYTDKAKRFIAPTVMNKVTFDDAVMQEEIFGPILPVIPFTNLDEAVKTVKDRPKPLSCYVYSKDKKRIKKILHEISFGGGAVNDSIMHLSNSNLPFGGVGASGMGSYHGKAGFDTFTHYKSIVDKPFWIEPNLKYPPYKKYKLKLIKWILG